MDGLRQLEKCGQSFWLDYVKRSFLAEGGLRTLIERDGLKGVTSNPSIFEKAIGESDQYAESIKQAQSRGDPTVSELYEDLAIADIRSAADILRPVFERTGGADGFISLECSPYVANDSKATVAEALQLWRKVERKNLMVKVPATKAGIPAIRELIGRGLNINITLLFSVDVYEQVAEAYMSGLEEFQAAGGDIAKVASVASFFVSRIDTAVDKRLDLLPDKKLAESLRGKTAIANAKLAYALYKTLTASPRWRALAAKGARPQRLLWASTSTKNPAYRDTMYVDELIGRDTVSTMPPATADAFRDHGKATPDTIERLLPEARATLEALARAGVSLDEVTKELVEDGVQLFADAFDRLLCAIARRRLALLDGGRPRFAFDAAPVLKAAYADELESWRKEGRIRRLWTGDASLWSNADEDKWVGWLNVVQQEAGDIGRLDGFAEFVKRGGFTHVLLLGMGGSSLGAEVLASIFGAQPSWPRFHMLDSTDPTQIGETEDALDLARTLVIVSSKSGGTLEPNILMDYFFERVSALRGRDRAGEHFVAITDPGSTLEQRARASGFADIFLGAPAIGGRYSVLSKFGLAPAAATGLDVARLLEITRPMLHSCGPDVPPAQNPGVELGVAMGVAARRFGRDKATVIASPPVAAFGAWLEQLLAESTGKNGIGLIPIIGEPLAAPERYGSDRFFIYIELEQQADVFQRQFVDAVAAAGHPVARIVVADIWRTGQEIFRWEMATAVAGAVIGVNPFNQPDVEASKAKTRALTQEYEKTRRLPEEKPLFAENGLALYADERNGAELGRHNTLSGYLRSHIRRADADRGDYLALLAYIARNDAHIHALSKLRALIHDRTLAASCIGFGPRFQHSTGQAYKGGPNSGVFLQITCDDPNDIPVPGHTYSFGVVKAAQAGGDFEAMVERGRRALRVHLKDVEMGLADLREAMEAALQ
jgi:transaldolase / glucose-6-phosphate isomerase